MAIKEMPVQNTAYCTGEYLYKKKCAGYLRCIKTNVGINARIMDNEEKIFPCIITKLLENAAVFFDAMMRRNNT